MDMVFKNDRQRKAVMSRINKQGLIKANRPKVNVVDFNIDLVESEFMNEDTDASNVWGWKKGQSLYRFTDGSSWLIHKVDKYPKSGIHLVKK